MRQRAVRAARGTETDNLLIYNWEISLDYLAGPT